MPHLDALQAGTYDATLLGPPRCAPEYIHTNDYLSLIDLLVALALRLPGPEDATFATRLDTMFAEKKYTLGTINEPAPKKAPEPKKGKGPAKDAPAADEKPAERPRHFYPRTPSRSRAGASRSGPPRSGPPRSGPPRSGPPRSGPPRSGP